MEQCDQVLEETGEEICQVDFIKEYMVAQNLAFSPETIMKAWAKCGICPFKPDIFTNADFAPSASTSTQGHFLVSYPFDKADDDDLEEDNYDEYPDDDDDEGEGDDDDDSVHGD
jgi:hypothetical protein